MAIRYKDAVTYGDGKLYVKANLTSADTKPTSGIATGSVAIETDTGKSYVFDEDSGIWTELKSSGGGITPTGTISITANGTGIDVAQYALADVNVGGGGGGMTLLKTENIGQVSVNTSGVSLDKSITISDVNDYDVLLVEISTTKTNGRHWSTTTVGLLNTGNTGATIVKKTTLSLSTDRLNVQVFGGGAIASTKCSQGVYPNSATYSSGTFTMPLYGWYSSTNTGTINGEYTVKIYGAKLYDLI